jgi:hypothetical protein
MMAGTTARGGISISDAVAQRKDRNVRYIWDATSLHALLVLQKHLSVFRLEM